MSFNILYLLNFDFLIFRQRVQQLEEFHDDRFRRNEYVLLCRAEPMHAGRTKSQKYRRSESQFAKKE